MICLRLFVALLTATAAVKESKSDEYLIFASLGEDGLTTFYKTEVDSNNSIELLKIPNVNQPLDNLFVNLSDSGHFLFWSYEDSDNIGYLNLLNNNDWKLTAVEDARKGVFLGPGDNDKIFVYLKEDKKFRAYNFKTNTFLWDWDWFGHEDEMTDMQCMARDPCHKELMRFAVWSGTKKSAYKINIETQKNLHKIALTDSYETWKITPNDDKVFAAKGRKIYKSERNHQFKKWLEVESKIIDLAIGQNYLFVITRLRKLFRVNWKLTHPGQEDLEELNFDQNFKGTISNLIVYQTSKDIC